MIRAYDATAALALPTIETMITPLDRAAALGIINHSETMITSSSAAPLTVINDTETIVNRIRSGRMLDLAKSSSYAKVYLQYRCPGTFNGRDRAAKRGKGHLPASDGDQHPGER